MTQDAIVVKVLPNSMAEVVVTRSTACGSNCGSCESCIFQSELKTLAKNRIGGQKVVISSSSRKIYSAAILVYIMPLLFFLAGFAVSSILGASEGVSVLVSFLSLAVSAAVLVVTQRRKPHSQQITFDIIS